MLARLFTLCDTHAVEEARVTLLCNSGTGAGRLTTVPKVLPEEDLASLPGYTSGLLAIGPSSCLSAGPVGI